MSGLVIPVVVRLNMPRTHMHSVRCTFGLAPSAPEHGWNEDMDGEGAMVPSGAKVHRVAPSLSVADPAGQGRQVVRPFSSLYVPISIANLVLNAL